MKTLFVITFTSVVINGALAQSFSLGPCPKVNTVENLDIERVSYFFFFFSNKIYSKKFLIKFFILSVLRALV